MKISERILRNGASFALVFPLSRKRVKDVDVYADIAYFFTVIATDAFYYEWDGPTLLPKTGTPYKYLGDAGHGNGGDILRIVNDPWRLYHISFSVIPETVRVYHRLGGQTPAGRLEYSEAGEPDPIEGSPFGFVCGDEISDIYDPDVKFDIICWRQPETTHLWEFGFYNTHLTDVVTVKLLLVGAQYKVAPVADASKRKEIIQRIIEGKTSAISVAGLDISRIIDIVPSDWDVCKEEGITFD